jgi:periplasmic protein TonB
MRHFQLALTIAAIIAFVHPLTLHCQEDSTKESNKSETVVKPGRGVTAPRVIHSVDPDYDKASRKAKVQGVAVLSVLVTESGEPRDLKIVRSLNPALDRKAIEAVMQWKFAPATKDGRPAASRVNVEVNFRLY